MKKLTTLLASILLGGVIYATPVRIIFSMMSDDLTPVLPPHPKTPVDMPEACIDENIVTFKSQHDDYYLQLLDEDSSIVYSTYVPSSLTTVTLPSTLSGDYQLRLIPNDGNIYFYGYIMF